MATVSEHHDKNTDPCEILGISPQADSDELRAAYLDKIKQYSPDKAPDEFERIRDAYLYLKDPRTRIRRLMTAVDPLSPLTDLLPPYGRVRRFVGPAPWLTALGTALKEGRKSK